MKMFFDQKPVKRAKIDEKKVKQAIIAALQKEPLQDPYFTIVVQEEYRKESAKKHFAVWGKLLNYTDKSLQERISWMHKRLLRVEAADLLNKIVPELAHFRQQVTRAITPYIRNVFLGGTRWVKAFDVLDLVLQKISDKFEPSLEEVDSLKRTRDYNFLYFFGSIYKILHTLKSDITGLQKFLEPPSKGKIYEVLDDMLSHNSIRKDKKEMVREFLREQEFY